MKRVFNAVVCACVLLIGTCAGAHAARPGESCSTAIPIGKDYQADVSNGQTVWYSAWTFDLPLSVSFVPKNGKSDPAPEVELDFSCTSGFYEDSILCSLFCKTAAGSGITFDMPYKPTLQTEEKDGKFMYYLSLGKKYRDLLLQKGIAYNLEVYVKVTYKSNGTLKIEPDDFFTNCMDGPKFMHIGDTVMVQAKDKERHVIVPYVQWQEDTIVYKWTGTTPMTLAVARRCKYDPTDNGDTEAGIIQFVKNIQPGDSVKAKATDIYKWVHNKEYPNEAGMYFAKFYSDAPGVVKVTKAPQAPPRGKATLLRYGRTYALDANTEALYAISESWNKDTKFSTPTAHVFRMSIAKDPDFAPENVLAEYQYNRSNTGHWLGLSAADLTTLWSKTLEKYLYVRFECTEATTISPTEWEASGCYKASVTIPFKKDTTFTIARRSTVKYRFYLADWKDGDITVKFSKNDICAMYVSDACTFSSTSEYGEKVGTETKPWLAYRELEFRDEVTLSKDDIAKWTTDEDGYVYMRFFADVNGGGKITMKSGAKEETDPEYPQATIAAKCEGKKVTVSVSKAQHIVVKDAESVVKEEWDAEAGTPHELKLSAGTYILTGEKENLTITLP